MGLRRCGDEPGFFGRSTGARSIAIACSGDRAPLLAFADVMHLFADELARRARHRRSLLFDHRHKPTSHQLR
jgi:hypothetical protein